MKIKINNFIGIIFILFILSCSNNLDKVSNLDNGKDDSISSEKNENNIKHPTLTPTATVVPTPTPTATIVPTITPRDIVVPAPTPTAIVIPTLTPTSIVVPTLTPTSIVVPTLTPTATLIPDIIEIINISNFKFGKESLNIIVGSTVLWINNDSSSHTVSSSDNTFSSGFLSSGQKYKFTFLSPGTYTYKCDLHSSMKGIIKVVSTNND